MQFSKAFTSIPTCKFDCTVKYDLLGTYLNSHTSVGLTNPLKPLTLNYGLVD